MKDKLKLMNDEPDPISEPGKSEVNKIDKKESKEKGKPGRPTLLTPELYSKLIKLFEDHFFIAIVAAKSNIYRSLIYAWQNEREEFQNAITHAQDKWIAQEMDYLIKYASNKKKKDWRAREYRLSIARREYNPRKWMKDDAQDDRRLNLTIIIGQKDLTTSKDEAMKLIGSGKAEPETVSLTLFNREKEEKKRSGKPETVEEPPF